jgi:glycosyltransferase involved in cell wall biosynthesis
MRFLEAAALVGPGVRFLLVGDGPLRGELEARAGAVTLTGVRHDLPALLRRADLVAFSSDWEGLPLVALEALAAGTPVVSTPVEGMAELTESGAVTVIAEPSATALADAITGLLAEPLAERGERGRQLVAERYSPAAMLAAYEALYAELSGRRS